MQLYFVCKIYLIIDLKAREQELLMWRRRATYDPMKAAAEGRKKLQTKTIRKLDQTDR